MLYSGNMISSELDVVAEEQMKHAGTACATNGQHKLLLSNGSKCITVAAQCSMARTTAAGKQAFRNHKRFDCATRHAGEQQMSKG
jgi:hypothetical protein